MHTIFRLSTALSIGFHSTMAMAAIPHRVWTARQLAKRFGFSHVHVAKVMGRLVRTGLIVSTRGRHGGIRLARPPQEVTLLHIYETIEGPILPSSACFLNPRFCLSDRCPLGEHMAAVESQLRDLFSRTTLAHMAKLVRLEKLLDDVPSLENTA